MGNTAFEIGQKLAELCRAGQNLDAIDSLYSDDIVSIEACESPQMDRRMEGREAVRGKNQWWLENHDVHAGDVTGPFPHGDDRFCLILKYDVTHKPSGQRMAMEEVGLYTLRGGKIAQEEYFYHMDGEMPA